MSNTSDFPSLPEGWFYPEEPSITEGLHAELQLEVPPGHLLFGRAVEIFAYRHGSDDVLLRHRDQPERFTTIHLSWSQKQEINEQHPTVEFDGTFAEFLAEEQRVYGLSPDA